MSAGLWFTLSCAVLALLYGAITTKWLVSKSTGNDRMREIAAAIQEAQALPESAVHHDRDRRRYSAGRNFLFPLGWKSAVGFAIGAILSGLTGYIGMNVSVRANIRTAEAANGGPQQRA